MDYFEWMKLQLGSTANTKFPHVNFNTKVDMNKYMNSNTIGKVSGSLPENKDSWLKQNSTKIGTAGELLSSLVPKYQAENKLTAGLNTGYDAASDVMMNVNPLVGGIMKGAGAISDLVNNITGGAINVNNQKSGGAAAFDNILGMKGLNITPIGLANSLTKTKIEGTDKDVASQITMGYSPNDNIESNEFGGISRLFNKKGIKSMQNLVERGNTQNIFKKLNIDNTNRDLLTAQTGTSNFASRNYNQLTGGNSPQKMRILAAKAGIKIPVKLNSIISNKNVIPSGALHARKNNINDGLKEFLTHKGIPVVSGKLKNGIISAEKGGEIIQTAEIERNEIIFHKQLTDKLEKLYEKYKETNDDNVLVEAGKLLTYEILENTEDNSNLIKTI